MLKQTVAYTDFDDNQAQETLYFNLTKTELAENIVLKDELERIEREFTGEDKRQLGTHEIQQILDLVKTFMKLSYGVRSADGKRFMKSEEQWTEFSQTAVYDAFLFGLFTDPTNAMNFMSGILPKELRAEALSAAKQRGDVDIVRAFSDGPTEVPLPEVITKKADFDKPLGTENGTVSAAPGAEDELAAFRKWQKENKLS